MPNAIELSNRYRELLDFLPIQGEGKGKTALTQWCERHGKSYRQILRDLAVLEIEGLVRSVTQNKAKYWNRATQQPAWHEMSREQAFMVHLVEKKIRHLLPGNLIEAIQPQWSIASKVLNRPEYVEERKWFEKVRSLPPLLLTPKVLGDVFPPIINALLNEHWLAIDYENQQREEKHAEVMPLCLAEREHIYYLVVCFKGYVDIRHIRLDRVSRARELEEPFQYPENFDLQSYIDSGAFNYTTGNTVRLEMLMERISANHLLDSPLAHDQVLDSLPDGRIRVSATVQESERLFWWILGFGSSVEIVKPEHLRNNLMEEIEAMRLRYVG